MNFNLYDTAPRAQTCTDEEMHKLHTLRNTPPIFRVPSEVLATIFIDCALDHYIHHVPSHLRFACEVPDWINVSYVCRHWRNVALGCPLLWTYHFVVSPRWTDEQLVRSEQTPLKIRLYFEREETNSWWLSLVEKLMEHIGRFEELILYLQDWNAARVLSMLSSCAPCLKTLSISTLGFRFDPEQSFLPFHANTPALRSLHLSYFPVPWWSFNLSSLTTLGLSRLPRSQRNLVDVLSMLSCMQGLKALYLNDVLTGAAGFLSSAAFRTFQKVNLPHLSSFSISAPQSAVIAFLSCVTIPVNIRVQLDCKPEDVDGSVFGHYALLPSLLAQRFSDVEDQTLSGRTIRSFAMVFSLEVTTLVFSSLECDCSGFDSPWCWEGDNLLRAMIWTRSVMHVIRPSDIYCSIPLTNVQNLLLILPRASLVSWRKVLGHLQGLRRIMVQGGDMPDLADVLSITNLTAREDSQSSDQQNRMLLPRLEVLEFRRLSLTSYGIDDTQDPAFMLPRLFDALLTRNAPHGQLIMVDCWTDRGRLDMVRSWGDLADLADASMSDWDSDFFDDTELDDV